MINSKIIEICEMPMPAWSGMGLYMHPVDLENIQLPAAFSKWLDFVKSILVYSPAKTGRAFVTIDEKEIQAGQSHRRGGAHVDGNYTHDWRKGGGNGWLTGTPGRLLTPEKHTEAYCAPTGGLLMISSHQACNAWPGAFEGVPGQGGDCEHIRSQFGEPVALKPNRLYWMNSTGIHKSEPVKVATRRSLVRITLPANAPDYTSKGQ